MNRPAADAPPIGTLPGSSPPGAATANLQGASSQVGRATLALATGGFAIGTGEFVIMGLLPDVATDLSITIPEAGHMISAYALGVVIGAPVLAVLGARLERRAFLIALMVLFGIGNLATALAPDYHSLGILRLLTGLPHGTYFGVAALVVAALSPPDQRARAVGLLMLGLTTATLIGVPIAAGLGQLLSWRAAFVFVAAIAVLTTVLVWRWVPRMPAPRGASPLRELGALGRRQVWLTLAIGSIGFGGMFAVFSYVKPTLMALAGLTEAGVPIVLALFGIGMVLGNVIGARLADRALMPAIGVILAWTAVVLGAFWWTASDLWWGAFNVLLIGTAVALGPALQVRLMDVAGDAQTLAAALNHSAFNLANALGAWLGGLTIAAGWGWASTGPVGVLLAIAGIAIWAFSWRLARRNPAGERAGSPVRPGPAAG